MATYLDPQTFDYLDPKQIKAAEKKIYELFPYVRDQTNSNLVTQIPNLIENSSRFDEINNFNKICGVSSNTSNVSAKILSIKEELAQYISTKSKYSDISAYWRDNELKLPKLSSLVRKYCIIQASSVASESAFSIANYIQRKERSSLSAENLRYSMFLRQIETIEKLYQEYYSII